MSNQPFGIVYAPRFVLWRHTGHEVAARFRDWHAVGSGDSRLSVELLIRQRHYDPAKCKVLPYGQTPREE